MEEWKQIKEYPDYEISNLARVRGKTGRILKTRDKIPAVEIYTVYPKKTKHSVARLYYIAFINPMRYHSKLLYRDGNPHNITKENLLTSEDRAREIVDLYNKKTDLTIIANTYRLAVKTVKNILIARGISFETKEFTLSKHSSRGKIESQTIRGEFTIPYGDNCTAKPKSFAPNAYLDRQYCYNYWG